MVTQELLTYIRQQLAAGIAKESIRTALMSQGWSQQDITEGFMTVEKSAVASIPQTPIPPSFSQPIEPIQSTAVLNEKASMSATGTQISLWAKGIPRTNNIFMIISLLLIFGLDLFVIISSLSLAAFWYIMLGVFAVFAFFYCLENFVFRKKFANTTSAVDKWISMIIVIRNLIFLLNFIPFIQLLGLAVIAYGGWILGIIYIALIITRFSQTKKIA